MPSIVTSDKWFVRIDGPLEFLREKLLLLSVETQLLLAVYHTGKKGEHPHTHFVCSHLKEVQKQSWDIKIKKLFSVSGHQYSSKVWDGRLIDEGAGTYLFHEDTESPILCKKNVTDDEINAVKKLAKIVNTVVAANKDKAETKIPSKVYQAWISQEKPSWNEGDIVRYICKMAASGECYLPKSDWQWKAYVEETKLKMSETPAQFEQFVQQTLSRLYFNR